MAYEYNTHCLCFASYLTVAFLVFLYTYVFGNSRQNEERQYLNVYFTLNSNIKTVTKEKYLHSKQDSVDKKFIN